MERIFTDLVFAGDAGQKTIRRAAELLRSRASLLKGKDRLLLTTYLDGEMSIRAISRLTGVNESSLRRRIGRLIDRLTNGPYVTCLRYRHRLSKTQMRLARDYFLDGFSIRQIAQTRQLSYYSARKQIRKLSELIEQNR